MSLVTVYLEKGNYKDSEEMNDYRASREGQEEARTGNTAVQLAALYGTGMGVQSSLPRLTPIELTARVNCDAGV